MAAASENKSMMIVWVVGAALVILGIVLAMSDSPAEKPMTDAAPKPAAEKPMAKDEAPKPAPAAPAEQAQPAAPAQPATPAAPAEQKPQ